MTENRLEALIGQNDAATDLFQALGVQEPGDLAGHWSVATPQGRAWLVDRTGIREAEILKWGFASELVGLGVGPRLAIDLVERGVTLHKLQTWHDWELEALASRGSGWYDVEPDQAWFAELKRALEDKGDELQTIEYYDLLVVSDFHLAAGDRPSQEGLARLSPTEDFYFDDAFFRFLVHCEHERRARQGYPYELVFNGDMVDFIQIVTRPVSGNVDWYLDDWLPPPFQSWRWGRDLETMADAAEPKERLWQVLGDVYREGGEQSFWEQMTSQSVAERRTDRFAKEQRQAALAQPQVLSLVRVSALQQLQNVSLGHRRFFQGLAWFLACGNRLVLIRGNHDVQWYWPEVQIAFLGWLWAAYEELVREVQLPNAAYALPVLPKDLYLPDPDGVLPALSVVDLDRRVDFDHAWFYYRDRLVYLEHGGQHEAVDAHRHFLVPVYGHEKELDAPRPEPSLDELKQRPPQKATDWLPELAVTPQEKEIDPAQGSLGNVYLINNLEIELPNFERPGYTKVYFPWLLYHRPALLFRKLLRALWRLVRAWCKWTRRKRRMGSRQQSKREAYARLTGLEKECVRELDETRWVRRWRGPASGWFYILLSVVSVVAPTALALVLVLGVSEKVWDWLSLGDWLRSWLPIGIQELLGLVEKEKLLVWDFVSGALKTLALGFLSYWGVALVRDGIGLGEDYLYKPSLRVARILKKYGRDVPYLLFGHDHARNAQPLDLGAECHHAGCITRLHKWGFLPSRKQDKVQPWKWRRHVRFVQGRLETAKIECPHCQATVKEKVLHEQLDNFLRTQASRWPNKYRFNCPHPECGKENVGQPDTDWAMETVRCQACDKELSWQEVESSPSFSATARDLGMASFLCGSCKNELPDTVLDQVRVYPHAVVYACPDCGNTKRQRLDTWHLTCPNPECGKKPNKWDLQLTEDWPFIQCSCDHVYPPQPRPRRWYLNTGTWMHFFATERKRLVREVLEHPFVRLIGTDCVVMGKPEWYMDPWERPLPVVELLRWNDAAQRIEICETFKGAAEG